MTRVRRSATRFDIDPKKATLCQLPLGVKMLYRYLCSALRYHEFLYYERADPEASDAEYDAMYNRLVALEAEYPGLVNPDSPTQKVGH